MKTDVEFKGEVRKALVDSGVAFQENVIVVSGSDSEGAASSGKTYEKITPREGHKVYDRLIVMRDRYHGQLKEAGVIIDVLLVHAGRDKNGEPNGPALKHQGYAAMATIKKVGLKDRVAGLGDAILVVDGDKWDEWTDAELDALLDHELTHIELVSDETGALKRDDAGRPKLRIRLHDFQIGGFNEIAQRHKEDAAEVVSVQTVARAFITQGVLQGF